MLNGLRKFFKILSNNRGEISVADPAASPVPDTNPTPAAPAAPAAPVAEPTPEVLPPDPAPAAGGYDTLAAKKGYKTADDMAQGYIDAEAGLHRVQNNAATTKQQLEAHGYTIDNDGNVIQMAGNPNPQPPYAQPGVPVQTAPVVPGQPAQPATPQEAVYDPYTGLQITDPIDMQLSQMPLGQRMGAVVNVMLDQREGFARQSAIFEKEVLDQPAAKGFEDDVRKVMAQVPVQHRATKQSWEKALWEVKGMRYDTDKTNWGKQGVERFINKDGVQAPPGGGGGGKAPLKLTAEQEQTFQYYETNQPTLFKGDRAKFLASATRPDGGR